MTKRPTLRVVSDNAQPDPAPGDEPLRQHFESVLIWQGRPRYYSLDADGQTEPLLTYEAWIAAMNARRDHWCVGADATPRGFISTVFLGLDQAWCGPPKVFETALFPRLGSVDVLLRYSTLEDARKGHAAYVAWARGEGPNPEEIEA